jgi:hypothetical protein
LPLDSIRGYVQAVAISPKKLGSDSASISREGTVDFSRTVFVGSSLVFRGLVAMR